MNRRHALQLAAAASATASFPASAKPLPTLPAELVKAHDAGVDSTLKAQVTTPGHFHQGNIRSGDGLFYGGTPSGIIDTLATALMVPQSKHYGSALVKERLKMAVDCFARIQTTDGNFNLPTTNYNSPPDTSFILQGAGITLWNARQYGLPELEQWYKPAILKAADALVRGGIHTPNHRWVLCSALAGIHTLYPDPRYLRRIDQWLAEGIDIDADGQFTERSTGGYNGINNRALVIIADNLQKWELLEPIRKNLNAMAYLMHPDGEVVTEISRRQDLNTRGYMYGYFLPIAYLAARDQNRLYATMARMLEPKARSLSNYLRWPEAHTNWPKSSGIPDNYEKTMPALGAVRIRRGLRSTTLLQERDRFFLYRHGDAVVQAVRFVSAFYGKAQFYGKDLRKEGNTYTMQQQLQAPYYQPLDPVQQVGTEEWETTRVRRKQTEISHLTYQVDATETEKGWQLRIRATGTDQVPVTIEVNLREGGKLTGNTTPHPNIKEAHMMNEGWATYQCGANTMRIGPATPVSAKPYDVGQHLLVEMRGALPKLPGPSLYLTGHTPFDHTITFESE